MCRNPNTIKPPLKYVSILSSNYERGDEWIEFSKKVLNHINDYTVPQYNDFPLDEITKFTPEECMSQIQRYVARFGKNARVGQDELDLIKIAHYACTIWSKKYGKVSKLEKQNVKDDDNLEQQEIVLNGITYIIRKK